MRDLCHFNLHNFVGVSADGINMSVFVHRSKTPKFHR